MTRSLSVDESRRPIRVESPRRKVYTRDIMTDAELTKLEIEELRLERLKSLEILDSEEDEHFNNIVELCSKMFNVPIALISLIDRSRSWVQAAFGMPRGFDTERSVTFCTHAIEADDVFQVKDARKHRLFKTNPYVEGDPKIRFYAGAPLTTDDGFKLGTLCILDQTPRSELGADQTSLLKSLAKLVVSSLEKRKKAVEVEIVKQQIEASEKLKGTILSHTAHEIRTPLTSILGLVDLMLDSSANGVDVLSETQTQYLSLIKEAGISLHQLLSDILDLSKLEASKLAVEQIQFDPKKIGSDVVEFFRPKCKKSTIRFEYVSLNKDPVDRVYGDPTRVRQVLWNFTSNAIKFTPVGEILIRIEEVRKSEHKIVCLEGEPSMSVSEESKEIESEAFSYLRFEVKDSGIGMSKSQLEKICQPFQQAEDGATARKYGGTGLGLVICNKLINLMGGRMTVKSGSGSGTSFSFTLALKKVNKKDVREESKSASRREDSKVEYVAAYTKYTQASSESTSLSDSKEKASDTLKVPARSRPVLTTSSSATSSAESTPTLLSPVSSAASPMTSAGESTKRVLRVLVADDNITIRMLMERLVKRLGHQCVLAENGEQALQILREIGAVDVFFCDMNMPLLDGPQTITALRETFPSPRNNIPVYAFSAETIEEAEESCKGLGISGVLSKPVDLGKLKLLLSSLENLI